MSSDWEAAAVATAADGRMRCCSHEDFQGQDGGGWVRSICVATFDVGTGHTLEQVNAMLRVLAACLFFSFLYAHLTFDTLMPIAPVHIGRYTEHLEIHSVRMFEAVLIFVTMGRGSRGVWQRQRFSVGFEATLLVCILFISLGSCSVRSSACWHYCCNLSCSTVISYGPIICTMTYICTYIPQFSRSHSVFSWSDPNK